MVKFKVTLLFLGVWIYLLSGCGGGSSSAPQSSSVSISRSSCTFSGDDSVIDTSSPDNGFATDFTRSHLVGSPTYKTLQTRQLTDGTIVSIDYMVHVPTATPKALIVLIGGGAINSAISGTENGQVFSSGGNFLVRSAHRYMQQGYKVVTVDRPDDFSRYGAIDTSSFLYDDYRNSMEHAVDIASLISEENTGNWPVAIMGTSRGAISAAANNTLSSAIGLSSPLTSGSNGSPLGSSALPPSIIQRPVHILFHEDDACVVTKPENSELLAQALDSQGLEVSVNAVRGGFSDAVLDDPCGAFDYHGFNGIENCAVSKEIAWLDQLVTQLAAQGNSKPNGIPGNFTEGDAINLSGLTNDTDPLTYSIPFQSTTLGGLVSVNSISGQVTYSAPQGAISGTTDRFVYVVEDGLGGVATAVVSITLQ